jgi:hypothetical protein
MNLSIKKKKRKIGVPGLLPFKLDCNLGILD